MGYSVARHFWPESKSIIKSYLANVLVGASRVEPGKLPAGIAIRNDLTISFILKGAYPPLIKLLTVPGFGVLKSQDTKQYPVIGSGSFRPQKHVQDKEWILMRAGNASDIASPSYNCLRYVKFANDKDLVHALDQRQIDLAIGFSSPYLDTVKLPAEYRKNRLQSFGTLHLYTNASRPFLSNSEFRKDLRALIAASLRNIDNYGFYLEPQDHLLPRGLMPHRYYRRSEQVMTISHFKKKWAHYIAERKDPFLVYLRKEYLAEGVVFAIKRVFQRIDIPFILESKFFQDMIPILQSEKYDLAMMAYTGVHPDPDGFLEPFREDAFIFRYGVFPTERFFQELDKARFVKDARQRLDLYAHHFMKFEEDAYIYPLFKWYFPSIVSSKVILPDTKFSYRFDLLLPASLSNEESL